MANNMVEIRCWHIPDTSLGFICAPASSSDDDDNNNNNVLKKRGEEKDRRRGRWFR
jgi:hypothetical protein